MKHIDKIQHSVLDFVTFFTYFLYVLVAFGISATAPKYFQRHEALFPGMGID